MCERQRGFAAVIDQRLLLVLPQFGVRDCQRLACALQTPFQIAHVQRGQQLSFLDGLVGCDGDLVDHALQRRAHGHGRARHDFGRGKH
ncbi:hypothetical protein D3C72_2175420 [compost metagenome]